MMKLCRLWVVCLVAALLSGCATSTLGVRYPHAGAGDAEISRDLQRLPQDLLPYAKTAGGAAPLLSQSRQETLAREFVESYYAPWKRSSSLFKADEVFYMTKSHPQGRLGYAENMRPVTAEAWQALVSNANRDRFPSRNDHGIVVCNTSLRAMPTHKPFFKNPEIAGEGYPFDYFSHSALWIGSPVYISHVSADGLWIFVETQRVSGWAPVKDIALVDNAFKARWRSLPLGAVVRDGLVLDGSLVDDTILGGQRESVASKRPGRVGSGPAGFGSSGPGRADSGPPVSGLPSSGLSAMAHVGALLPLQGDKVFYPVRNVRGDAILASASLKNARVSPGVPERKQGGAGEDGAYSFVQPFPQPLTANALAQIGNIMMGQPYGWGGYLDNRDCSALMMDIFTPFGLWLPRNSSQQAKAGRIVSLEGLSAGEKRAHIQKHGKPFSTLIWLPGHVVLYVGEYDGISSIYHDIWGITIQDDAGVKSRAVIGKVAITSLSPGIEHPLLSSPAGILDRMGALVLLGE